MHTGTASAPVCTIFFLRSAQLAGLFQRGVDCIGQPLCCCLRRHALLKDLSDGIDHSMKNAAQRYRRNATPLSDRAWKSSVHLPGTVTSERGDALE